MQPALKASLSGIAYLAGLTVFLWLGTCTKANCSCRDQLPHSGLGSCSAKLTYHTGMFVTEAFHILDGDALVYQC